MATHRIPVTLDLPDASGNAFFEPAAVNFQANDRYPHTVAVFKDTATRVGIGFSFRVPANYVGAPKFKVLWATTATTGDFDCEIDYRAIAAGESVDPSTDQENLAAIGAADAQARECVETELAATAGNFAANDLVVGTLFRDGADADTIAASVYVLGLMLEYSDV